jgi:hypothetical protein
MASSIGDIVATLGVDDTQWNRGLTQASGKMQQFGSDVQTHAASSYRSFMFLGREIQHVGGSVSGMNETLGSGIEKLGGTVSMIGMAEHSAHALGRAYESLAAKQVILNALSGPVGWIALAGAVVAAGGAFYYFSRAAADSKESLAKANEAAAEYTRHVRFIAERNLNPKSEGKMQKREYESSHEAYLKAVEDQAKISEEPTTTKDHRDRLTEATVKLTAAQERLTEATKHYRNVIAGELADDEKKYLAGLNKRTDQLGMGADEKSKQEAIDALKKEAADKYAKGDKSVYSHERDIFHGGGQAGFYDQGLKAIEEYYGKKRDLEIEDLAFADRRQQVIAQEQAAQEEANKTKADALRLTESMMTPQERMQEKIRDYLKLLDVGAISEETYDRARKGAMADYNKTQTGASATGQFAGAAEAGTSEAWTNLVNSMDSENQTRQLENIAANTEKMVKALEDKTPQQSRPEAEIGVRSMVM